MFFFIHFCDEIATKDIVTDDCKSRKDPDHHSRVQCNSDSSSRLTKKR